MDPASFDIDSEERGAVSVISVRGELDLSTAPRLEESVNAALEPGDRALTIDLSNCEFIDSTGIALIVNAWRQLDGEEESGRNGRFALCGLSDQVRRLFDLTGLEASIPMHQTLDEALAQLSA